MIIETVLFMLRHTPFWSVPTFIIGTQFAYTYWLKGYRKISIGFAFLVLVATFTTVFYIWAGGPDNAPSVFFNFIR